MVFRSTATSHCHCNIPFIFILSFVAIKLQHASSIDYLRQTTTNACPGRTAKIGVALVTLSEDRTIWFFRKVVQKLTVRRQSALTDFLASHNISAHQISQDFQRRQQEAEQQQQQQTQPTTEVQDEELSDDDEDPVEKRKRKRKEEMAIMKIKASKEFKRRKHMAKEEDGSDAEDDDAIARRMLQKAKPLPGQLENCEICEKRFTVTPYSKTGPDGGLLCTKCSKEMKDEEKKAVAQQKKRAAPKARKRQTESDRMMGDVKPGAKSLVEQCVKRVADVVNDIDEFGDLPQSLLDKLSQILSKRRVIDSRTLKLFLNADIDRIAIYDSAKLETEDFEQIFAFMPDLEFVNLRFAGQLKDSSLDYMIDKSHKIRHLQLGATNLISDQAWIRLFQQRGNQLESLKLSELNDSLRDHSMVELGKHCQNLKRLKLRSCSHISEISLQSIAQLTKLEHLSLSVAHEASSQALADLIRTIGPNLKTLSLEDYVEADDAVLGAILDSCHQLTKLRFTGNSLCTDRAFAELFGPNSRNPPLQFVDFSSNRDTDQGNPDGDETDPIGFGSAAFKSLMRHSGPKLTHLDVHSCRHISHEALSTVFDGKTQYEFLKDIDLSFVTQVDEVVMAGIFKSCPKLQKLAVFACFSARGARIPENIAVIGLPNPNENIYINEDALMGM